MRNLGHETGRPGGRSEDESSDESDGRVRRATSLHTFVESTLQLGHADARDLHMFATWQISFPQPGTRAAAFVGRGATPP